MNIYKTQPPWEFLLSASRNSLQSYELSRLSHAANLRKEIGALLDQWIEENSAANLARWLMEHRERPEIVQDAASTNHPAPAKGNHSAPTNGTHAAPVNGTPASDNNFGDPAISPLVNRRPS